MGAAGQGMVARAGDCAPLSQMLFLRAPLSCLDSPPPGGSSIQCNACAVCTDDSAGGAVAREYGGWRPERICLDACSFPCQFIPRRE